MTEKVELLKYANAGLTGAARSVLIGHRIAEARQQPSYTAPYQGSTEAANDLAASLRKRSQHTGLIFRIQVIKIRLRLKEVAAADHNGDLSKLRLASTGGNRSYHLTALLFICRRHACDTRFKILGCR
jgi:hypothetical protein